MHYVTYLIQSFIDQPWYMQLIFVGAFVYFATSESRKLAEKKAEREALAREIATQIKLRESQTG